MAPRLMRLIALRHLLPKRVRAALRARWMQLLVWEHDRREKRFYRQFVRRGDLVFDVGAHIGVKTRAFLSLGAKVIAVEPNPECVARLGQTFRVELETNRLHIVASAVAGKNGQITLTIFDAQSAITSGSSEFVDYARSGGFERSTTMTASAVTLDELITQFGLPTFLKLDLEGMDADVLHALSQRPPYLSFEYHGNPLLWETTRECFAQVTRLGFTQANLTGYANPEFILASWVSLEEAIAHLTKLRESGEYWGDVVVR